MMKNTRPSILAISFLFSTLLPALASASEGSSTWADLTVPKAICQEIAAEYGIKALNLDHCATQSVVALGWEEVPEVQGTRKFEFLGALREGASERACAGYLALDGKGEFVRVLGLSCQL